MSLKDILDNLRSLDWLPPVNTQLGHCPGDETFEVSIEVSWSIQPHKWIKMENLETFSKNFPQGIYSNIEFCKYHRLSFGKCWKRSRMQNGKYLFDKII